ncbi:unannotated protein [freshwater metagenome]|uniref:Unannotated protein n=1 Tax=freshwater metagenome TaxID=449393 RepID=A0A6J7QQJ7_9ZZZZ
MPTSPATVLMMESRHPSSRRKNWLLASSTPTGMMRYPTQLTMRLTSLRNGELTSVKRRASSASFAA